MKNVFLNKLSSEDLERVATLRNQIIEKLRNVPKEGIEVEYLSKSFKVLPTVFWPHDDSKPLVENFIIRSGEQVLDVCTGSGVIAVFAALQGAEKVIALDSNPIAVKNVQLNAERFNLSRIIEARVSDVFSALKDHEKFDVITCNPPFTNEPAKDEAEATVRDQDFAVHQKFFDKASYYLKPSGRIYMSQANFGNVQNMLALAKKSGFRIELIGKRKLENDPREFYAFEMSK